MTSALTSATSALLSGIGTEWASSSRLIVEAGRPKTRPMARNDFPSRRRSAMVSRSVIVKKRGCRMASTAVSETTCAAAGPPRPRNGQRQESRPEQRH